MVEQLSVFLANEPGRLARLCRLLGDAGLNMHALVVADTADYGVVRVICDRPYTARGVLERDGFAVSVTRVIAAEVPDRPGGLADMLELLDSGGVNVEYLYCFLKPDSSTAVDVLRVEDAEKASALLTGAGISLLHASEVYQPDAV
ncbi:MAG TPA: ACT domain-containing protein [Coriobacteriia bacterium]